MKKKKLEKFSPHLFLVGIVAIVAVVAVVIHGSGITGGAQSYKKYVDEKQLPCVDSDPTNNFYVAGKVHVRNMEYHDFCTDGKVLHQFKCGSTGSAQLAGTLECPDNKPCVDGICVS